MEDLLCKLGLEEKEAIILLYCFGAQETTPTAISKDAGLKRATVYFYLERLEAKGLIHYQIKGKSKRIVTEDPSLCIEKIVAQKKTELDTTIEHSKKVIEKLQTFVTKEEDGVCVECFSGKENCLNAAFAILRKKKDIYWIGGAEALFSVLSREEFYQLFTLERMKHGTTTYAITDSRLLEDKRFSEVLGNFRQFRILPKQIDIPAVLAIVDDQVVYFANDNGKLHVVSIKNPVIRDITMLLFQSLWDRSLSS